MSWRWVGGVPAYLPPLFLRKKQAMSTTRVRSTTAHMVPMNQPLVEMVRWWTGSAEDETVKGHYTLAYFWITSPSRTEDTDLLASQSGSNVIATNNYMSCAEFQGTDTVTAHVLHQSLIQTVFILSPGNCVWIMSSKMLALSSNLLVMRRTVYTVPGLSPSIMWKLWEVFTASEIRQLPSPTQPSTRSAQAASRY